MWYNNNGFKTYQTSQCPPLTLRASQTYNRYITIKYYYLYCPILICLEGKLCFDLRIWVYLWNYFVKLRPISQCVYWVTLNYIAVSIEMLLSMSTKRRTFEEPKLFQNCSWNGENIWRPSVRFEVAVSHSD